MTERLDRIENILAETQQIVASNARAIQGNNASIAEIQQIVASNARAIEANSAAIAESKRTADEDRAQFRASIEDMVGSLVTLGTQTFERIDEMQSEIRGIQTENRRIWELLEQRDRDN